MKDCIENKLRLGGIESDIGIGHRESPNFGL